MVITWRSILVDYLKIFIRKIYPKIKSKNKHIHYYSFLFSRWGNVNIARSNDLLLCSLMTQPGLESRKPKSYLTSFSSFLKIPGFPTSRDLQRSFQECGISKYKVGWIFDQMIQKHLCHSKMLCIYDFQKTCLIYQK